MFSKLEIKVASLTLFALVATLGCGNHKLVSVSVTPAIAVVTKAGGQVQFSATGTYNDSSKPVPLMQGIVWCVGSSSGVCNGNITAPATISGNGLAQCVSPGRVAVLAGTGTSSMTPDVGQQLQVFGTAQLVCP